MDKIQQLILDTYNLKPKHFTQILKRNTKILDYLKEHASHLNNFLEQLYFAVYKTSNLCPFGNVRPLKTFSGYSFCGRAGVCQCARDSVSKSVSNAKSNYTIEEKEKINDKRKQTTLELYGVSNNGQTPSALSNHRAFYDNKLGVESVVAQIKRTKLINYGDDTYNNREQAEKTCLAKYGVKNTWSLTEEKQNPNLNILRDKDQLSNIFPKFSVDEISTMYSLHAQTVYYYLNKHGFREPYKSTFEKEIVHYLNELGITNILTNKRNIIGKELDIFLPDYNLAIEYNGVYWHHDKIPYITKTYHYDKFKACEDKGIELFSIFSDSWEAKKDIWKRKIRAKLQLSLDKVYARKTICEKIDIAETRQFLNNNHVQGYCVAQYAYCLKVDDKIVAVMTFSNGRTGIGKFPDINTFELVRYATSCSVIGGASKILTQFIKDIQPQQIISYSDNQYSVGNLYKTLNFTMISENKAGYRYYNPTTKKMYHRYSFTKYKLIEAGFDPAKTEKEIMNSRGFLRIWDCGTRTWALTLT
jgi:G:T-mismatch repair DNA endonuclease (very short patch repair protein)